MTTLAELVVLPPDDAHGRPIQLPAVSGEWRFVLEIADPLLGVDVAWLDITDFYASDRYQRGASEYMGKARAAVAQVHLTIDAVKAADIGVPVDILAPWGFDTTPLFGGNVTLDAGLFMRASITRVAASVTVEWHPLWTGRVETWGDSATARGQIRDHLIVVSDLLGDLVNVPTLVETNPWDDWIVDLLGQANWPFGVDIYGDLGTPSLPSRTDVQPSAINELDAACDPMGLVWRTLRNGRLVIHPAPWDTTHTIRYDNPLLAAYPLGLVFNWNPDLTDIEYIADDDNEQPGLQRTSLGVINTVTITTPTSPPPYAIDDPTSQSKYGMRPFAASWFIDNDPVADDILSARADASQQALPLRSTIDHQGFFPALAMVDHLDPVTFIHSTHADGAVVTATGTVRTITEVRELRHGSALSWESSVQIDVTSSAPSAALRGPIDLEITSVTDITAAAAWENPTQPDITPTEIQYRLLEQALIWISIPYDGVGAQTLALFALEPSTIYTLQVRIVRRVNGIITHTSNVAQVQFSTHTQTQPTPVPDDDDTDVDIPGTDDPDNCVLELELWENDGSGWVEVDSWDQSEMTPNGDGTYRLTTPIPNSFFNEGSVYRFVWREICGGVPGPDVVGPDFDPPDDWTDPCTDPPALSVDPWDSADLLVYVPKICAPDIITEAVSGIAGIHGAGYGGLLSLVGDPNYRAIVANTTGGIIAYGECPQITGFVGSKSLGARVFVPDAEFSTFFECGAMRLTCTPDGGSNFKAGATVFTADGTGTCLSSSLDLSTAYELIATYDAVTGDLQLYVDGVADGDTSFGEARDTINALPTWFAGGPPETWVTDCAFWDGIIVTPPVTVTINKATGQDDPTLLSPILFDVVFSEPVTGFTTGDVTLSGTAGATTGAVSGSGATYLVTVTGMSTAGTVIASIAAAVATSVANGDPNEASTSTDNSVQFDSTILPRVWYEPTRQGLSSGSSISSLTDYSGNARHATTSASPGTANPTSQDVTINGIANKIMRGNGSSMGLDMPTGTRPANSTESEVFIVQKNDADPPTSPATGHMLQMGGDSTNRTAHFPFSDSNIYETYGTGTRVTVGNPTAALTSWHCYNIRVGQIVPGGGMEGQYWLDNTNITPGGTTVSIGTVRYDQTGPYLLHDRGTTGDRWYDGDVALVVVYDGLLGTTQRQAVRDYITAKFGITF